MKKIVYGSLSVLTAVFTVFVAAKAEVLNGDRANTATSEGVENGEATGLPQTPDSLFNGLGSSLDGSRELSLDKNAMKADMNALSSASLTKNTLGQQANQAFLSQDLVAKRLPASAPTNSLFSARPQVISQTTPATAVTASPVENNALEDNSLGNGGLESDSLVEVGQPATADDNPFITPDSPGNSPGADALRAPAQAMPAPTRTTGAPTNRTEMPPVSKPGIDAETDMDAEMEPEMGLEDPTLAPDASEEKLPAAPSGNPGVRAPGSNSPGLGSPVKPLPGATPGSGIPDGTAPNAPSRAIPVSPTPGETPTRTPISPGGSTAPLPPITPGSPGGSSGMPFPENPSAAPVEPITPLKPIEEDVIPGDGPTSGMELPRSSDRLSGAGFSPFQLAYLAIGGGLEGIPGGAQLLAAYHSGDVSAADIVNAGAASNRLGSDASNQSNYIAGVDRFLMLFSKDN